MKKKEELEKLLVVGAKIKIGKKCARETGLEEGKEIVLQNGYFEYENGLCTASVSCPSIWSNNDWDSIYHLFENDLSLFLDSKILKK